MEGRQHLISIAVTLWILVLLYFPRCISLTTVIIVTPTLISSTLLLLTLLKIHHNSFTSENQHLITNSKSQPNPKFDDGFDSIFQLVSISESNSKLDSPFTDSFVEWDVRAPLEVIYEEESENEDEENGGNYLQRHASLSKYFPESDSDSGSSSGEEEYPDWDNKVCFFKWDEEDDTANGGLIEIALEEEEDEDKNNTSTKALSFFNEEENMIEIEISPARSSRIPIELKNI